MEKEVEAARETAKKAKKTANDDMKKVANDKLNKTLEEAAAATKKIAE